MFVPHSGNFIARLRARKQSTAQNSITPTEAVWFLSLPDKVRRQHFTKEEQILIRAKSEIALLDASPETLSHVEEAHQSPPPRHRTHSVAYDKSQPSPLPSPSLMPKKPALESRKSYAGYTASSPKWQSPEIAHDAFLTPQYVPQQQTFLRSPTIINQEWESPQLNVANSPSIDTIRPRTGRSMSQTSQRAAAPPPIDIKKPLYLKDPSTKALLRDCVSNKRFEETLTFGFPTNNAYLRPQPELYDAVSPGTTVRQSWLDASFYQDEDASDDGTGDLSSADEIEPPTPDSFVQPQIIRSKLDDDYFSNPEDVSDIADAPQIARNTSNTSYFEELMNRDMTLRMTLTKPELRASEEELYGWQDDHEEIAPSECDDKDPLALEELTYSDDTSGLGGAFAQNLSRKKGIKGFWFKR